MNRCAICDVTDQDNPKAGIKWYSKVTDEFKNDDNVLEFEARCLECHNTIQEAIEDLSLGDEDFSFAEK